jgi:hypothetical protein
MTKLDFKDIDLSTKELFNQYASAFEYENMEACFSNLFIWKKTWNIQYAEAADSLILCMCHGKVKPFMLPPMVRHTSVSIKPAMDLCRDTMLEQKGYFLMRGANDITKGLIERDCPGEYAYEEDRRMEEYIYRARDLIELPGDKYHAKKNHVNRFLKQYAYTYKSYNESDYSACMDLYYEWARKKGATQEDIASEEDSVKNALTNYKALGLKGCVITIEGKVCAFSIGEAVNHHMAVIHIEKADAAYNGIYQFVNCEFAKNEWKDFTYINRQEDMGIEGLRKAKESYHPDHLVKKYICTLRGI